MSHSHHHLPASRRRVLSASVLSALLAACGGGGVEPPEGGEPGAAIGLDTITPANASAGTSVDTDINVRFTHGVDASTVTGESFSLYDRVTGERVPATVSVTGANTARLSPRTPLALAAAYEVRLARTISGPAGAFGGATASFSTRDGQWDEDTLPLFSDNINGTKVAMDAAGNAIAVARGTFQPHAVVMRRYSEATQEWSPQVPLSPKTNTISTYALAMNGNGQAIIGFSQDDDSGTYVDINYALATASQGVIGTPALADTSNARAEYERVAIDPSGNAAVVWQQSNGGRDTVWAKLRPVLGGNQSPQALNPSDTTAVDPQVAMDAAGNTLAVWRRDNEIWARFNDGATGQWADAVSVTPGGTQALDSVQLAMDARGNAVAVWEQGELQTLSDICAARFDGATRTWGPPSSVDRITTGFSRRPQVAMDGAGYACAIWEQRGEGTAVHAYANRMAPDGSWGTAVPVSSPANASQAASLSLAVDPRGNALAVWKQGIHIYSSRYTALGNTWSAAAQVNKINTLTGPPKVALDARGRAMVVFLTDSTGPFIDTLHRFR